MSEWAGWIVAFVLVAVMVWGLGYFLSGAAGG